MTTDAAEEALYHYILDECFAGFLSGDTRLLAAAQSFDGAVDADTDGLSFCFPDLYRFIPVLAPQWAPVLDTMGYRRFRQMFYSHPTNDMLKKYAGTVIIARAGDHVDSTLYRLTCTTA